MRPSPCACCSVPSASPDLQVLLVAAGLADCQLGSAVGRETRSYVDVRWAAFWRDRSLDRRHRYQATCEGDFARADRLVAIHRPAVEESG